MEAYDSSGVPIPSPWSSPVIANSSVEQLIELLAIFNKCLAWFVALQAHVKT